MTVRNDPRPKLTPAAPIKLHFHAMYPSFPFFQKSLGKHDPFTLKSMQNKPNLNKFELKLIDASKMTYLKSTVGFVKKTNPIQTQFKPKQSQFSSICPANHKQAFHLINQARFGYASIICNILNVYDILFIVYSTLNAICNILTGSQYED